MIAKLISSQAGTPNSFALSARYVLNAEGSPDPLTWKRTADYILDTSRGGEKVESWRITNCVHDDDPALATKEILNTQAMNTRAKSAKHIHLVVSFDPSEKPDEETLKTIEDRLVGALRLSEHQRISALHNDTDHLHFHVIVNKIHPETFKIHSPPWAKIALMKECAILEKELGLLENDHGLEQRTENRSQNRYSDQSAKSAQVQLGQWAQSVLSEELCAMVKEGGNWQKAHQLLAYHGLEFRLRGAGLSVYDKSSGQAIKASAIARECSLKSLTDAFGEFEPPTEQYREITPKITYEPKPVGDRTLWDEFREHRDTIKTERDKVLVPYHEQRRAVFDHYKARAKEINDSGITSSIRKRLYRNMYRERDHAIALLPEKPVTANLPVWKAWLQEQADAGREDALECLRSQQRRADRFHAALTASDPELVVSKISKLFARAPTRANGSIVYHCPDGGAIVDNKKGLDITKPSENAMSTMLALAAEKYGNNPLAINGTEEFSVELARTAGQMRLKIRFRDNRIDKIRQSAMLDAIRRREAPQRPPARDR